MAKIDDLLTPEIVKQISYHNPVGNWRNEFIDVLSRLDSDLITKELVLSFGEWSALGYPISLTYHLDLYNYDVQVYHKYIRYYYRCKKMDYTNPFNVVDSKINPLRKILNEEYPTYLLDDLMKHKIAFTTFYNTCESWRYTFRRSPNRESRLLIILDDIKIFDAMGIPYSKCLAECNKNAKSELNKLKLLNDFSQRTYLGYLEKFHQKAYETIKPHLLDINKTPNQGAILRNFIVALELLEDSNFETDDIDLLDLYTLYTTNYAKPERGILPLNYLLSCNMNPIVYANLNLDEAELMGLTLDIVPYQPTLFAPHLEVQFSSH